MSTLDLITDQTKFHDIIYFSGQETISQAKYTSGKLLKTTIIVDNNNILEICRDNPCSCSWTHGRYLFTVY